MPVYDYITVDKTGARSSGQLEADSLVGAQQLLRDRQLIPVKIQVARQSKRLFLKHVTTSSLRRRLGRRAQITMLRQLAILLDAGTTLPRALAVVAGQASGRTGVLADAVRQSVTSGQAMSAALDRPESGLRADLLSIIAAGEGVGTLGASLARVADIIEARAKLQDELLSALLYPVILMFLAAISVGIVVMYLVPSLAPVFEGARGEMPLMMRLVMDFRSTVDTHQSLYIVTAGIIVIAGMGLAVFGAGRNLLLHMALRLPQIGTTLGGLEAVRFTTTLSALLSSEVVILDAIRRAGRSCMFAASHRSAEQAAASVAEGNSLSIALRQLWFIKPGSLELLAIGEESNRLAEMLDHVAAATDLETRIRTERLIALIPPLLTIGIGLFVGGIILSVMQAITSLNQLIQ